MLKSPSTQSIGLLLSRYSIEFINCKTLELCCLYNIRKESCCWIEVLVATNFSALTEGKYSCSVISMLFLVQSAKLEYLSEIWSCLYSVKGFKSFLILWSVSWGRSCVSVRAIISLLKIFVSSLMSILCFLRDRIFRRDKVKFELFSWIVWIGLFVCCILFDELFRNLSYSSWTLESALTFYYLFAPECKVLVRTLNDLMQHKLVHS